MNFRSGPGNYDRGVFEGLRTEGDLLFFFCNYLELREALYSLFLIGAFAVFVPRLHGG